jgi:hypothetical protein
MCCLAAAAAVAVTACGSGSKAAHKPPAVAAKATMAAVSNATACAAFQRAVTTGSPVAGENAMSWLLSQDHQATPALKVALGRYANAWGDPADVAAVDRAKRAVKRLCGT